MQVSPGATRELAPSRRVLAHAGHMCSAQLPASLPRQARMHDATCPGHDLQPRWRSSAKMVLEPVVSSFMLTGFACTSSTLISGLLHPQASVCRGKCLVFMTKLLPAGLLLKFRW